jgi:predicted kinase
MTLVTGAPCSGKNLYVARHKRPGDLVVDFDALMCALGGDEEHYHAPSIKPYVFAARDAVLELYARRRDVDAWVIKCAPKAAEREAFALKGFRVVVLDTPQDVCLKRAAAERPREWLRHVYRHFEAFEPGGARERVQEAEPARLPSTSGRW